MAFPQKTPTVNCLFSGSNNACSKKQIKRSLNVDDVAVVLWNSLTNLKISFFFEENWTSIPTFVLDAVCVYCDVRYKVWNRVKKVFGFSSYSICWVGIVWL